MNQRSYVPDYITEKKLKNLKDVKGNFLLNENILVKKRGAVPMMREKRKREVS